ncbi:MAG: beta-galactosidase [Opitutaceae bacterium]|jgi:hypothetical protein
MSLHKAFFIAATTALVTAGPTLHSAPWTPSPDEGWRPLPIGELYVKPGSALDFSALVEPGPAGQHGQVIINAAGQFVFEKQPGKPLRFFTCGEGMEYWQPKTDEEIAAYARQVRLAGYNCFRPHFLDHMLMIGATEDLKPNPGQLDRWDRLSAELKKQGVYLYFDINTSWVSYYATKSREDNWSAASQARNIKTRIYWEREAREHWEKSMRLLLDHVNPYTGLALKDEPQVVFLQLRNEAGLHFQFDYHNKNGVLDAEFQPLFRTWLKGRYGDVNDLNQAWGSAYTDFAPIPVLPKTDLTPPAIDFQRFMIATEVDTYRRLKATTESTGTRAIILDFNAGVHFAQNLTNSIMPIVDNHSYHDHPTSYINPGSTQPNQSSASTLLDYFVWLNESRQLDRPFIVSEWGFPYWNQWRYEAGVGLPAYAAFQGWQMLAHHAEPIRPETDIPLRPFKIAYDPGEKASERMAALLFARGDVSPSRHALEIRMDPESIFTRWGGNSYMTSAMRTLPLLTKSGQHIVDFKPSVSGSVGPKIDATLTLDPEKRGVVWLDAPEAPAETATDFANHLRSIGVLSADNRTNPEAGIFETDTRQLLVDSKNKIISVDTPRSQGVALPEDAAPVTLSTLHVENQGPSATFFVGSLDNAPLTSSERMLIIAVGDAVNTGAVFADASRKELRALGTLPVLAKPLHATLTMKRGAANQPAPTLWGLSFNGERIKKLPVRVQDNLWVIKLDATQDLSLGNYYELETSSR